MKPWNSVIQLLAVSGTVSLRGVEYATEVASLPPSRNPSNARGNLIVDFASHKMGHTCAVESATLEAADAQVLELDDRCIGYFPQPKPLPVLSTCRDGRKRELWLTFDFMVLRADGIEIHECKPEAECVRLSQEFPGRYQKRDDGAWGGPEIETALAQYGFKFRIVTESEVPPTLLRNYAILAEVTGKEYSNPAARAKILNQLDAVADGIALRALLERTETIGYAKNDIYIAIARRDVFTPLADQLLVDDKTTRVFAKEHHMEAYRLAHLVAKAATATPIILKPNDKVTWNKAEYSVCNVSKEVLYLRSNAGDPVRFTRDLFCRLVREKEITIPEEVIRSQEEIAQELVELTRVLNSANHATGIQKLQFLRFLKANPSTKPEDFGLEPVGLRTVQRWKESAQDALHRYGSEIWGLIAKPRPGRPRDDLSPKQREVANAVAEELYFSPIRRKTTYCWREYKRRSDEIGLRVMSKGAFRRHLRKMRSLRDATDHRQGHRAAYKYGNNPGNGKNWITACDFPFKVGQIDGKLKDLEVVDHETGEALGRPSITLLLLPYYGVPIGYSLMLEPESYRSATMAVRDAYKRFGQVVRFLTPDNGKAFNNTTFDKLLGLLGISKMPRPPDDPRFSAELESFWRILDVEVIHNMSGNTQASRDAREMTDETKPERHAVWTLPALYDTLEKYFFELLWEAPSARLGTTPRKAFERDLARAPDAAEFALPANLTEIAFLPEVKNSTRLVQPGRGVYVEGYYYWNDNMNKPYLEGREVIVRYDPYDLYHVFVLAGGDPIECEAKHAPELRNVTERYRHLHCMARRRLKNDHGEKRERIHGPRLAALGLEARAKEKLLREERRARANPRLGDAESGVSAGDKDSKPKKIAIPDLDFSHLRQTA